MISPMVDFARELWGSWWTRVSIVAELIAVLALFGLSAQSPPFAVLAVLALFPIAAVGWDVYTGSLVGRSRPSLRSELSDERAEGVATLSATPSRRAVASLRALSANRGSYYTVDVQIQAALALARRNPPDVGAAPGLKACLDCASALREQIDRQQRVACAQVAARLGDPVRALLLSTVESDESPEVRSAALRAVQDAGLERLTSDEVTAVASRAADDPRLVAGLLARGGSAAVKPLAALLANPRSRNQAAESLSEIRPCGIRALIDCLEDVPPSSSAAAEFLASVSQSTLTAIGLRSPGSRIQAADPVITALARVGAETLPQLSVPARRSSSHVTTLRVLERIGEPAVNELVLLLALQAQEEGIEWAADQRREVEQLVDRRVQSDLDTPRSEFRESDTAVIEALCWAGARQPEVSTKWLLLLLDRVGSEPRWERGEAAALVALHILWAGRVDPPGNLTSALLQRLMTVSDLGHVGSFGNMDRTFHQNWLGASIDAAAAVCREGAYGVLGEVREQLERLSRNIGLGLADPLEEMIQAATLARERIANGEPRQTLLRQVDWPWPVDRDSASG